MVTVIVMNGTYNWELMQAINLMSSMLQLH